MKNRTSIAISILCMILIINLTGCTSIQETEIKEEAKGFLWEATKGGSTVYLIGTMHPAPTTHNLLSEEIINSIKNSDVLWVEVDLTNNENINKLEKSYYLESGKTIKDYLSKEYITKLENILRNYNMKLDQVETYNSMMLTSVLDNFIYEEMGFIGPPSDNLIIETATKNSIKIKEIEGVNKQVNALKKIYTWEYLEKTIDDFNNKEEDKKEIKVLFENYVKGDVKAANKYEDEIRESYDNERYSILLKDRNIKMVEKINEKMSDGKKHILAVGYRHFMGEDSIINLLKSQGYTVREL